MAYRELQPLIKKAPSFRGVSRLLAASGWGQHPLWLTRVGAATCKCATEGPDESESNLPRASPSRCQPPLLLGPVFPGCHRKRVITPP